MKAKKRVGFIIVAAALLLGLPSMAVAGPPVKGPPAAGPHPGRETGQ